MIHKGKALTFLKEFDKAKNEFENARLADSKQSSLIDGIFFYTNQALIMN